ncbi:MAG: aldo/keto reductase [Peptococcaceae bacterium]|jgi:aryl-alcohol dehydrogenase-like predicted oxidoreductase|nr:aldo/keto reductase [Peptococcaceae bacterium]
MEQTIFGKTGLTVSRTGFGCIPIQRISFDESTALLRRAYEGGITFYDTANGYTTSEERIGIALHDVRDKIVLCTKSFPGTPAQIEANLDKSLKMLQTDYIDIYQVHNPSFVPRPGGDDGVYDFLLKAKEAGKIRHIGITNHSKDRAREAILSDLYDTLQYPLSCLSSEMELELVDLCREHDMGVLAMKALSGGLITNAKAAFAFLRQYDNVVPIWGMQRISELDEFLSFEKQPPVMDADLQKEIEAVKAELQGDFCRGCGYCLPCAADIPIPTAGRITFLLGRSLAERLLTPDMQEQMKRIDNCTGCGHCKEHCPYGLDVPELLKRQKAGYFEILAQQGK